MANTLKLKLSSPKFLMLSGVAILGISYPATLICNECGVDFLWVLYATVTIGSGLILLGMAKYFN